MGLMQGLRRLLSLAAILLAIWPLSAVSAETFPDKLELVGLLRAGQFEELEARMTTYQKSFEASRIPEQVVAIAFSSFDIFDPDLESKLNLWRLHIPDSYAALLARGLYYENLGWNSRGTRYAEDTSEQRFAEMYDYFSRAITDLELAIELNKKLSIAYGTLIKISKVDPELIDRDEILEVGLRAVPSSLLIRYLYLASLVPWWGGSLTEIWFFIERTMRDLSRDLNAKPLEGYYDYTLGRILARDGHYKESLEYYDKALSYGENPAYRIYKGKSYYSRKLYDKARAEFEIILERDPQNLIALGWRAGTHRQQTRYDLALADLETAIQLNPFAPGFLRRRAYLLRRQKRYEEAERDLTNALVYGYYDESIHYARGYLYLHYIKNYQKAAIDLKRATLLAPDSAKYWYEYATALYYTVDCDIIAAVRVYLKLCKTGQKCPDHNLRFARTSLQHLSTSGECSVE